MYRHLTVKLHAIARSPEFRLVVTDHARKQMRERDVILFEVEKVLKAGAVTMAETDPPAGSNGGFPAMTRMDGALPRWFSLFRQER